MLRNTIVSYKVFYKDGTKKYGQAPFRSNEEDDLLESMKQFVAFFFAGPPDKYDRIQVQIVKNFGLDEDTWIQNVYRMDRYRDMFKFHGYGGELIVKHGLGHHFR